MCGIDNLMIGINHRKMGLCILDKLKALVVAAISIDLSSYLLSHSSSNVYQWYSHLGHVLTSYLRILASIRNL